MPADNETVEAIAPVDASADWCSIIATGHKDICLLVYTSGYQSTWSDGEGWTIYKKDHLGDHGAHMRCPPAPYMCIRLQGPVGETARVVTA